MSRNSRAKITRLKLHNPGNYEVIGAIANVKGHEKRVVIIAAYMPPSMNADQSKECMQYLVDLLHEAKQVCDSPHIYVAGDFNQFQVQDALAEHADLKEVKLGKTRGNRAIDRSSQTFMEKFTSGVRSPLFIQILTPKVPPVTTTLRSSKQSWRGDLAMHGPRMTIDPIVKLGRRNLKSGWLLKIGVKYTEPRGLMARLRHIKRS
jgi:hypothetical protein